MGNNIPRERHKSSSEIPGSPKEGQPFVFENKPDTRLVFQTSNEENDVIKTDDPEFLNDNSRPESEVFSEALPTVFKWDGGGKQVFISGTFTDWKHLPMVRSHGDFVTIIDLPEGDHQYKFYVDGESKHDPKLKSVDNDNGSKNNLVSVRRSDFEVFQALAKDIEEGGNNEEKKYSQDSNTSTRETSVEQKINNTDEESIKKENKTSDIKPVADKLINCKGQGDEITEEQKQ